MAEFKFDIVENIGVLSENARLFPKAFSNKKSAPPHHRRDAPQHAVPPCLSFRARTRAPPPGPLTRTRRVSVLQDPCVPFRPGSAGFMPSCPRLSARKAFPSPPGVSQPRNAVLCRGYREGGFCIFAFSLFCYLL